MGEDTAMSEIGDQITLGEAERRIDGPAEVIDEAVVLATVDGVGPALNHMTRGGVNRGTALRVLCGPEYHRLPDARTVAKFLRGLANRIPSRNR